MDTTPEYIKMRLAAIHDLGTNTIIKESLHWINDNVFVDSTGSFFYAKRNKDGDLYGGCQLERQDQLQEMVKFNQGIVAGECRLLMNYIYYCKDKLAWDTWEQLWLAFVMKEKYEKAWNGEEWVNE